MFGKFKRALSPKRRLAAVIDAVVDRMNEKYIIKGRAWLEDGELRFSLEVADVDPLHAEKVDLNESVEE